MSPWKGASAENAAEMKENGQAAATQSTKPEPSTNTRVSLHLAGDVGVPDNHPSAPAQLSMTLTSRSREGRPSNAGPFTHNLTSSPTMSVFSTLSGPAARSSTPSDDLDMQVADPWPFREALQSRRVVLVEDCSTLIEHFPVRVWDELPNAAVVVPIASDSDEGIPGAVLVIGLSIRRPFDEDYQSFIVSAMCQVPADESVARVRIATTL